MQLALVLHGQNARYLIGHLRLEDCFTIALHEDVTGEKRGIGTVETALFAPLPLMERQKECCAALEELAGQCFLGAWPGVQHPPEGEGLLVLRWLRQEIVWKDEWLERQQGHGAFSFDPALQIPLQSRAPACEPAQKKAPLLFRIGPLLPRLAGQSSRVKQGAVRRYTCGAHCRDRVP